jgi:hypothetical protein
VLDDPAIIVNMSVWEGVAALEGFVFRTVHRRFYLKWAAWFDPSFKPALALWQVAPGALPTLAEGIARWTKLRDEGPGADVFGWNEALRLTA